MNTKMDIKKREELIKLAKEFAVVEPWEDGDGATIKIDLTAAGYYKPHKGLTEIVDELFPEYNSIASDLSPDGILSYCCEVEGAEEQREAARDAHFEKIVFPYIKENLRFRILGDESVPLKEQEIVCSVAIGEKLLSKDIYLRHSVRLIRDVVKQQFPEYAWELSFRRKDEGTFHIILISEALWKNRLADILD